MLADDYPHAWTPDNDAVIFESSRNGTFGLFRQKIDEQEPEPLVLSNADNMGRRLNLERLHKIRGHFELHRYKLGGRHNPALPCRALRPGLCRCEVVAVEGFGFSHVLPSLLISCFHESML